MIVIWHDDAASFHDQVTFFAGILLFKNLPRQQFGEVQSAIFPWYFGFSFILNVVTLATWIQLEVGMYVYI